MEGPAQIQEMDISASVHLDSEDDTVSQVQPPVQKTRVEMALAMTPARAPTAVNVGLVSLVLIAKGILMSVHQSLVLMVADVLMNQMDFAVSALLDTVAQLATRTGMTAPLNLVSTEGHVWTVSTTMNADVFLVLLVPSVKKMLTIVKTNRVQMEEPVMIWSTTSHVTAHLVSLEKTAGYRLTGVMPVHA